MGGDSWFDDPAPRVADATDDRLALWLREVFARSDMRLPLILHTEQVDVEGVAVEFVLPPPSVIQTWARRVSQRQRDAEYVAFVSDVALKLAAATFELRPDVAAADVRGIYVYPDPATGNDLVSAVLRLPAARERFQGLRLDRADPTIAFRDAGGRFELSKRHTPYPITGLHPLSKVTLDEVEWMYREFRLGDPGEPTDEPNEPEQSDPEFGDPDKLLRDAAEICVQQQGGSTSLLQRRLRIGYGRAARLIEQLHTAGVLGPADGSKPRDVLVDFDDLERICGA